jgi:hypothetical protein
VFKNSFHRYSVLGLPLLIIDFLKEDIFRKILSNSGIPINTIQGTRAIVRINVLRNNGRKARGRPNRKRKNVIDG